jgi:hypothetical protein
MKFMRRDFVRIICPRIERNQHGDRANIWYCIFEKTENVTFKLRTRMMYLLYIDLTA